MFPIVAAQQEETDAAHTEVSGESYILIQIRANMLYDFNAQWHKWRELRHRAAEAVKEHRRKRVAMWLRVLHAELSAVKDEDWL